MSRLLTGGLSCCASPALLRIAMTSTSALLVIPGLAVGYLFLVYCLLLLAQRAEKRSGPQA